MIHSAEKCAFRANAPTDVSIEAVPGPAANQVFATCLLFNNPSRTRVPNSLKTSGGSASILAFDIHPFLERFRAQWWRCSENLPAQAFNV